MKKLVASLALFVIVISTLFAVPQIARAVDVIKPVCDAQNGINDSQVCKDDLTHSADNPIFGPSGVMTRAISIVSLVVGIVSIIIIVIAGIKFMTSQGNPQAVSTARNQIIYAIIGIVVASLAQGLVALILRKL